MFELRVLTGLHQSASLPLIGDQWAIGASEDCDLSLFDPGVKSTHLTLLLKDGNWFLKQQTEPEHNSEEHSQDETQLVKADSPFQVAGIWLTICSAELAWEDMQGKEHYLAGLDTLDLAAESASTAQSKITASSVPNAGQTDSVEIPTLYTKAPPLRSDEKKTSPHDTRVISISRSNSNNQRLGIKRCKRHDSTTEAGKNQQTRAAGSKLSRRHISS